MISIIDCCVQDEQVGDLSHHLPVFCALRNNFLTSGSKLNFKDVKKEKLCCNQISNRHSIQNDEVTDEYSHHNFCNFPVRITTSRTRNSYKRHRNWKLARINNIHNLVKSANLIAINPTKNGPPAPKIIPKCMVINTRSLAKPQIASALSIELSAWEIDICLCARHG